MCVCVRALPSLVTELSDRRSAVYRTHAYTLRLLAYAYVCILNFVLMKNDRILKS